ncbi:unnamed protein product [Caretta caretta]
MSPELQILGNGLDFNLATEDVGTVPEKMNCDSKKSQRRMPVSEKEERKSLFCTCSPNRSLKAGKNKAPGEQDHRYLSSYCKSTFIWPFESEKQKILIVMDSNGFKTDPCTWNPSPMV